MNTDAHESLTPVERIVRPFADFLRKESASGLILMVVAAAALILANSPLAASWQSIWSTKLTVGYGADFLLSKPLVLWVNDGLMAIFFLLVGLEIRRELTTGELNTAARAALPAAAALGGMVVPALFYVLLNRGGPTAAGWGIPMATDIAFSLGIIALLGSRVPLALKVFLTALAIVDDLGAVVVIAIFYTEQISLPFLAGSLAAWIAAMAFGKLGGRSVVVFGLLAVIMWVCMLKSGVHATIAGVLMAFAIPARQLPHEGDPQTEVWEHALHPWVAFVIMPVFALANAGVTLGGDAASAFTSPAATGIMLGLVLGKPLGILFFSWLAVRLKWASLGSGVTWAGLSGTAILAGVGFTMSLFIAELAFQDPAHITAAKLGILTASAIAGVAGYFVLRAATRGAVTQR